MAIDPVQVRLAIQRFDLKGFLQRHGGAPFSKRRPEEWVLDCPRCGKEEKLTVNTRRRGWHCWICEKKGPIDPVSQKRRILEGGGGLIRLVAWLEGISTREAFEQVIGQAALQTNLGWLDGELEALEETEALSGEFEPIGLPMEAVAVRQLLPYMQQRRMTLQDAQAFGLAVCWTGRYANRLLFPVYEAGQVIYWQARAMWEDSQHPPGTRYIKALNPAALRAQYARSDLVLFNLEQASQYPRVCITEGPMDAMRVGLDAVCTFGKQISSMQLYAMLRAGVKAVDLMWDSDAHEEMRAAAPLLADYFDVRLVWILSGDPDGHRREDLADYRANAQPYLRQDLFRL